MSYSANHGSYRSATTSRLFSRTRRTASDSESPNLPSFMRLFRKSEAAFSWSTVFGRFTFSLNQPGIGNTDCPNTDGTCPKVTAKTSINATHRYRTFAGAELPCRIICNSLVDDESGLKTFDQETLT